MSITMKKLILITVFGWMLQGCGKEDNAPLEQGHTGPSIDVQRDMQNSPRQP